MSNKIPGPPCGWPDILDKATDIKLEAQVKEGVRYHPLRPSSAGKCLRALTIDLMEYRGYKKYPREKHEPALDRLFNLGHAIEYNLLKQFYQVEGLRQKYKQQTLSFGKLKRGKPELEEELLEGSLDACFVSNKYKGIMDVKSKKDKFSQVFKTQWDENIDKYSRMESTQTIGPASFYIEDLPQFLVEFGEDFMQDNFYQLNFYAMNPFIQERGFDHAFLVYYNKNDSRLMEMRFKPSQKLYDTVLKKFNKASILADKQEIPETCDFTVGTGKFAFCDCHELEPYFHGDGKREWFATWPKKRWPTDVAKLDNSLELQQLFDSFQDLSLKKEEMSRTELNIAKLLAKQKVNKVKLQNGKVFELKYLKSPRPHYEIRKGKV